MYISRSATLSLAKVEMKQYSRADVAERDGNDGRRLWIILHGVVYDVTDYMDKVCLLREIWCIKITNAGSRALSIEIGMFQLVREKCAQVKSKRGRGYLSPTER